MLKITKTLEAKVSVTVHKTGKTFYCSSKYAKHIIGTHIGESKEKDTHEYFLREDRGWRPVTEKEFLCATSEEVVEKLHELLTQKLRQRVEKLMSK